MGLVKSLLNCFRSPVLSKGMEDWRRRGTYFRFKGKNIFYIDEKGEKDDGSTLVLIHGYPTSSYDWIKIWPGLKKRFSRLIAPDMFGFGFSDKPMRYYTVVEQAEMVEVLLKQLNVTSFHAMGHDYGDSVCQDLIARYNVRQDQNNKELELKTLCLTNGGIFPETNFPLLVQRIGIKKYIGTLVAFVAFYFFILFKNVSYTFGVNTKPTEEELHDMWCSIRYNRGEWIQQHLLVFSQQRRVERDRWVAAMQKTKVPMHVIQGEADPINPPPFADYYRKLIPNSDVTVLKNIGHWPQMEAPEDLLQAYFNFMKDY